MHTSNPGGSISPPSKPEFNLSSWCKAIGCTRAFIYELPPEKQPRTVKIGRRRFVIETPREYLERMASVQEGK